MKFILSFLIHYVVGYFLVILTTMSLGSTDTDLLLFALLYIAGIIGYWGCRIYEKLSK